MLEKLNFFSIIIPTYNRPEQLASCLNALFRLDYPQTHFEVIIADDGSDRPIDHVISLFKNKLYITLITQKHGGPAAARNAGTFVAKGNILVFTDDDCEPSADWLHTLNARFSKTPDHMIGGRAINKLTGNPFSSASQSIIDYLYAYYNAETHNARFLASNNLAIPVDKFHNLCGFDTTCPRVGGEDRDLCDRWIHSGNSMTYASEVIVYHANDQTLSTFLHQQFNYGRGAFLFQKACIKRRKKNNKGEPLSFYIKLICHPFSRGYSLQNLFYFLLMFLSQLAVTAGYFLEKVVQQLRILLTKKENRASRSRT